MRKTDYKVAIEWIVKRRVRGFVKKEEELLRRKKRDFHGGRGGGGVSGQQGTTTTVGKDKLKSREKIPIIFVRRAKLA